MNFKHEKYPKNIKELIVKSHQFAELLKEKLNKQECLTLKELFIEKNNKKYITSGFTNTVENEGSNGHLYVFGETRNKKVVPVYVGITRNIRDRLRNHCFGKTHNTATLVYLIAVNKYRPKSKVEGHLFDVEVVSKIPRELIEAHTDINKARDKVQNFKVAVIPIEKDYELYFHEVAIAGILKTYWNSFKTH